MRQAETSTFSAIQKILSDQFGLDPGRIALHSDLQSDLGIHGDDGDELFEALDKAFDVDWSGLDLGVHFGNEGSGLPFPWQLKNNCVMYQTQPCRVADLIRAVDEGRWPETKLVPRSKTERRRLYVQSTLQFALYALIIMVGVGALAASGIRFFEMN
jgi:hypothetical protein